MMRICAQVRGFRQSFRFAPVGVGPPGVGPQALAKGPSEPAPAQVRAERVVVGVCARACCCLGGLTLRCGRS